MQTASLPLPACPRCEYCYCYPVKGPPVAQQVYQVGVGGLPCHNLVARAVVVVKVDLEREGDRGQSLGITTAGSPRCATCSTAYSAALDG